MKIFELDDKNINPGDITPVNNNLQEITNFIEKNCSIFIKIIRGNVSGKSLLWHGWSKKVPGIFMESSLMDREPRNDSN